MPRQRIRKVFDKEGEFCVLEIDEKKQVTTYNIRAGQSRFLTKIVLEGFVGLPQGLFLNRDGYGFSGKSKGFFFLQVLREQTNTRKPLELKISNRRRAGDFRELQTKTLTTIPFQEARSLLTELGRLNRGHNDELRRTAASFLSTVLRGRLRIAGEKFGTYHPGELAELLSKKGVDKKLSEDDLRVFSGFFQKAFSAKILGRKKLIKEYRIKFAKASRKITERVYLEEVIREFEERLKRNTRDEEGWQIFLKEKVFPFLTGYVDLIDKENIGVDESYPDFVLIDVYGFADVFEIKTHVTSLLTYDAAHGNYYWRSEIAEAISQIENYLDALNLNQTEYVKKARRKRELAIKVIKPRGYIIAGMSSEFSGRDKEKMEEDFRRLSRSLKNIDFILYDELLANLRNIRSKLDE